MIRASLDQGGATGRPSWRSSLLVDPTRSFHATRASDPEPEKKTAACRLMYDPSTNCPGNRVRYTVEFHNAFLELIWPDETVPVSPGLERVVHKFRQRMDWRTSGWSPIGIGMRRTPAAKDSLGVPTWNVTPGWLPPGAAIEMLTPRDDTTSPSLFVSPRDLVWQEATNVRKAESASPEAALFHHPLGVERVTDVRLVAPSSYQPIEALQYVTRMGVLELEAGEGWLVELTFDGGTRAQLKDLRPDLPLVLKY